MEKFRCRALFSKLKCGLRRKQPAREGYRILLRLSLATGVSNAYYRNNPDLWWYIHRKALQPIHY